MVEGFNSRVSPLLLMAQRCTSHMINVSALQSCEISTCWNSTNSARTIRVEASHHPPFTFKLQLIEVVRRLDRTDRPLLCPIRG